MPFVPDFKPQTPGKEPTLWFLFQGRKLLVKEREKDLFSIPISSDLAKFGFSPLEGIYLGSLDGHSCFAAEFPGAVRPPAEFHFKGLRELFGFMEDTHVWIAGRANQLLRWNRIHRYCGRCAHPTTDHPEERAKLCPHCGLINYPRVSPAVIVAVVRDGSLLLAHSKRFPAKFYSVLAGFVEPGESLEECVRREVHEEVGIQIKDIRYFGSQPWPFPDSLMVAFTARYKGGSMRIDKSEIVDAGWFSAGDLPPIPPRFSIARKLIDWFLEAHSDPAKVEDTSASRPQE